MSIVEAIVLGIVQGLTEFLPISSTAHLRIIPELFGWGDPGAAFTAVIQLGTLVAVILYFRTDIVILLKAVFKDLKQVRLGSSPESRLAWKIAVGTIPIVSCGLLFKDLIKGEFRRIDAIAFAVLAFTILLLIAEMRYSIRIRNGVPPRDALDISWWDAIFIGIFQALALIPGASRSGVTITAGLFVGLSRGTAARFSFLLSLPSIFGAGAYEMYKERHELFQSEQAVTSLIIASVVSGVVGYLSIAFLLGFLKKYTTFLFIVYRLILGIALLLLLKYNVIQPQPVSLTSPETPIVKTSSAPE